MISSRHILPDKISCPFAEFQAIGQDIFVEYLKVGYCVRACFISAGVMTPCKTVELSNTM